MKQHDMRTSFLAGALCFLLGVLVMSIYGYQRLTVFSNATEREYVQAATAFTKVAAEADNLSEQQAIPDCSARADFDALLMRSEHLSTREQQTLDGLFTSCGVHVTQLKDWYVETLTTHHDTLSRAVSYREHFFSPRSNDHTVLTLMEQVIEGEKKRAALLHSQTELQREILASYQKDRSRVTSLYEQNTALVKELLEQNAHIDTARTSLDAQLKVGE